MLDADAQERFSRHLLLDAFGGAGQERLCAGAAAIDLPAAFATVAASCARALAAAGVGSLALRGPWALRAADECRRLAPGLAVRVLPAGQGEIVYDVHEGARVLISAAGPGRAGVEVAARAAGQVALPAEAPCSPAEAAALGALAALEAMKQLGRAGGAARMPLSVFPTPLAEPLP